MNLNRNRKVFVPLSCCIKQYYTYKLFNYLMVQIYEKKVDSGGGVFSNPV